MDTLTRADIRAEIDGALARSRETLLDRIDEKVDTVIGEVKQCLRDQQEALGSVQRKAEGERVRVDSHAETLKTHAAALKDTVTKTEVRSAYAVIAAAVAAFKDWRP